MLDFLKFKRMHKLLLSVHVVALVFVMMEFPLTKIMVCSSRSLIWTEEGLLKLCMTVIKLGPSHKWL